MPCLYLSGQQSSLIMVIKVYKETSLSRQNGRTPMSCKQALAIVREGIDAEVYNSITHSRIG